MVISRPSGSLQLFDITLNVIISSYESLTGSGNDVV